MSIFCFFSLTALLGGYYNISCIFIKILMREHF